MKGRAKVVKVAKGIIDYLKKNGMEDYLPEVIRELTLVSERLNAVASVTTPVALSVSDKKKAANLVSAVTNGAKIKCEYFVDTALIDGMKIRFKDRVWDMSLSGVIGVLGKKS